MYCFSLPRVTWHDSALAIFCTSSRDILTARHISQLWTGDVAFLLSSQYGEPFVLIVWIGSDKTQWLVQATNRNREVRKFAYSVKPWILLWCDSEYTKKLGKYLLLQFYFHLQTFAYHLKGRKNIFVLDKMNLH